MKQNKIAMIYDFDGTLTPKTMQEYTLLPKLGLNPKSFWDSINEESKRTGGETMMVFMRHLLDQAKEKNIKISKNEFFKMGKDIKYYQGVSEWFDNINKYVKKLSGNDIQIYHYIISAGHMEILDGVSIKKYIRKIFASEYFYNKINMQSFQKLLLLIPQKLNTYLGLIKAKKSYLKVLILICQKIKDQFHLII